MNTLVYILIGIILVLIVTVVVLVLTRPKVEEISDDINDTPMKFGVMKLQNEICPYIYTRGNKVCLTVVKKKLAK